MSVKAAGHLAGMAIVGLVMADVLRNPLGFARVHEATQRAVWEMIFGPDWDYHVSRFTD